jgi:hypothetical protein
LRTVAFFSFERFLLRGLPLVLLLGLCGCLTAPPLPKVNLSESGWTVRQGQAIWKPKREGPEIAGELLLATRPDGSAFVQFTKTPIPFVIAQITPKEWQIEIPPQNRRYARHGKPPARVAWFQLAKAETGKPVAKPWVWNNSDTNWELKNPSSGESLEGYFNQ